jgi:hypothetical protein
MADLTSERVEFKARLEDYLSGFESGTSTTILATRLALINYVKSKIDELIPEGEGVQFNVESEPNIGDPYDLFINSILDEAAKKTLMSAPIHYIEPTDASSQTVTPDAGGDKIGYIVLPDNFLRLISLKMTDWEREVNEAITTYNPLYKLQRNQYVRGGVAKPVAAFNWKVITGTPTRVLEYYSIDTNHTIEKFLYVPETVAEEVQSSLQDALTWFCASDILQIIEMYDASQRAEAKALATYNNL